MQIVVNNYNLENNIVVKEITNEKEMSALSSEVATWQKVAEQKMKLYSPGSTEYQVAQDCAGEAESIRKQLAVVKKEKASIFAAYDQDNKIQGIAIARISKKDASELDNMVVNPESIKLIGNKPLSGTGTALVQRIANKILDNNGRKELNAMALHAAIPFYEKLGFKYDDNGGVCGYAEAMVLSEEGMKKLVGVSKQNKNNIIPQEDKNKVANYLVYATTKEYDPTNVWGGCHITVAGTQKNTGAALIEVINSIAQKNLKVTQWHPSDWEIQKWKGRYTMVIKSKSLREVAEQLKGKGVANLKGPDNGSCHFHVTLPDSIKSVAEAQKYAQQLSQKDWYLTVVEKGNPCKWVGHAPLLKS